VLTEPFDKSADHANQRDNRVPYPKEHRDDEGGYTLALNELVDHRRHRDHDLLERGHKDRAGSLRKIPQGDLQFVRRGRLSRSLASNLRLDLTQNDLLGLQPVRSPTGLH
jgi:hypothetical protein